MLLLALMSLLNYNFLNSYEQLKKDFIPKIFIIMSIYMINFMSNYFYNVIDNGISVKIIDSLSIGILVGLICLGVNLAKINFIVKSVIIFFIPILVSYFSIDLIIFIN